MLRHIRIVGNDSETGEEISDTKLLGFFESEKLCKEKILFYIQQPGFKDHVEGFVIEEVTADVDEYNDVPGEFKQYVYFLSHEYYDGQYDNIANIGYYSKLENAKKAEEKYMFNLEFRNHSEGFSIGQYEINQAYWKFGFRYSEYE